MQFQAQSSVDDLAPHPHRFELVASAKPLAYPPLCPNCGSAADRTLTYTKVFCGRSGDNWMSERH